MARPQTNRFETVTGFSTPDHIKVSIHIGYNVFGSVSAFWQDRLTALNAKAARCMQ